MLSWWKVPHAPGERQLGQNARQKWTGRTLCWLLGTSGKLLSKVGGRRGTITGPFSTSPFRTVLAPFSPHGSPVDDSHSGSGPSTSLALLPFNCHPPVPLPQ